MRSGLTSFGCEIIKEGNSGKIGTPAPTGFKILWEPLEPSGAQINISVFYGEPMLNSIWMLLAYGGSVH